MTRAKSTDAKAVKDALEHTTDFKGITGAITITAESHVPRKGVTIIEIKDQKFTLGAEVVPDKVPDPDLKESAAATMEATAAK